MGRGRWTPDLIETVRLALVYCLPRLENLVLRRPVKLLANLEDLALPLDPHRLLP